MAQPERRHLLKIQRMEMALVRARLAQPDLISEPDYQSLRYLLSFARLHQFTPGVAGTRIPVAQRARRADVTIDQGLIAPLRELVIRSLSPSLLKEEDYGQRLVAAAQVLPALINALRATREKVLQTHASTFSTVELDAEISHKALVTIMGGGGGAGYVYIGAAARLRSEGMASHYLIGASIGALIGAMLARSRTQDIETVFNWAKSLRMRQIFSSPYVGATHTLPGLMRLHLRAMHELLVHPDGSPLRIKDLEIPYEAVIAGIRTRFYHFLPATVRNMLEGAGGKDKSFSRQVAERMVQLTTFINPLFLREIVLGRDIATRDLRVADAVGLSAAIPTVLQYEPLARDATSDAILTRLREQESVALFADGGVVNNVPSRIAWEGVQMGRIGTRNAFYLALDCFQPQWDTRHLWLGPVQQLIQLQGPGNRPYFDWIMRFTPTLSPVNLLPHAADFDQAWKWGWDQADVMMPYLKKALEPISWRP